MSRVQRILQKRLQSSSTSSIKNVTVIGAGLMGAGIAQVACQHGYHVTMVDTTQASIDKGSMMIKNSLSRIAKKTIQDPSKQQEWVQQLVQSIQHSTNPVQGCQDADLVIEAIVENLQIKKDLFSRIETKSKPTCIFTSNTSSLPISDIAADSTRKGFFAGLHFFNPVPQMKLVEIVKTEQTTTETYNALLEFTKKLDKVAVTCKDTPGFIVNRLLVPYMMEAIRMVSIINIGGTR
jgi:3-hydroxyacyl-CoA dehydrogenase